MTRGEVWLARVGRRTRPVLVVTRPEVLDVRELVTVAEVTATGAYRFTRMLLGRAEVRQDWSKRRVFQRGATNADREQTTFHLQLIYTF